MSGERMSTTSQRVAVIGLWHQGVVGAACLADWGHQVVAADHDFERIRALARGQAPLFEPGLDELIQSGVKSGRLSFTTNLEAAVSGCPVVLLMHDTPVNDNDDCDLSGIFRAVADMAAGLSSGVVILVTAQLPVSTTTELAKLLDQIRPGLRAHFAYAPENLRLGQALERFRKPPLPVVGSDDEQAFAPLEALFAPTGVAWQRCNLRTAEMAKHALNSFLAVSICFANEVGNLCDTVGADGHRLGELLRLEPRIGSKAMLFPGLGFAGGTLARDLQTLRRLGVSAGLPTPLLDGIWVSNKQQNSIVPRRLAERLGGSLSGRTMAVWGLTYKPDTSTLRRSAALELIADLARSGVKVNAHDPKADRAEVARATGFTFHDDPIKAAEGADALILMTPWPDYKTVDFARVRAVMKPGALVFDTANLWRAPEVEQHQLIYLDIGRGRQASPAKGRT